MFNQKSQLFVILLIVFVGFVGASMAYPIFPPLFLHPVNSHALSSAWSNSQRSIFLGLALAAYPLGQFIGSPILGGYSDRFGRKRTLIFSLMGATIGYGLSALSLHYNLLGLLILSRFVTGLLEGNLVIVQAMAADLTQISKHQSFGRINAVAAIGYIMGPLLGGFLSDNQWVSWFSYALPFWVATAFIFVTIFLSIFYLKETKQHAAIHTISVWQQFNLIHRFQILFKNKTLKYLLIVSSIFTLGVDIFYEFGPVYLTGRWAMQSADIAIYNAVLCVGLSLGSAWLSNWLPRYFSVNKIMITGMLVTAIYFAWMVAEFSAARVFLLYILCGFSIAVTNTNMTVQVSNTADKKIQGEAMGTQYSLRMLGDATICLLGGFLIIQAVVIPLLLAAGLAVLAGLVYFFKKTQPVLPSQT